MDGMPKQDVPIRYDAHAIDSWSK